MFQTHKQYPLTLQHMVKVEYHRHVLYDPAEDYSCVLCSAN